MNKGIFVRIPLDGLVKWFLVGIHLPIHFIKEMMSPTTIFFFEILANAPFGNEGNAEDIKDFIIVEDMKDWSKIFINRENIESFGPTRT